MRSTDLAGNFSSASARTTITIDTMAPGTPDAPVLVAGNDSGRSSSDGVTDLASVKLTGTAEAGSTVTVYDGATLASAVVIGSTVAGADGRYAFTTVPCPTDLTAWW